MGLGLGHVRDDRQAGQWWWGWEVVMGELTWRRPRRRMQGMRGQGRLFKMGEDGGRVCGST